MGASSQANPFSRARSRARSYRSSSLSVRRRIISDQRPPQALAATYQRGSLAAAGGALGSPPPTPSSLLLCLLQCLDALLHFLQLALASLLLNSSEIYAQDLGGHAPFSGGDLPL